jgi:hypothetical protein
MSPPTLAFDLFNNLTQAFRMMDKLLLICCLLSLPGLAAGQPLSVSENHRYLVDENDDAFFWLGDTAWELFHRLNREEADHFLETRAAQGFTVIQAVVLAEFDGLTAPNAYGALPLIDNDPSKTDDAYFEHVDYIVDKAASLGLYIGMLPTWGDKFNRQWGVGPEVFTPANARTYGEFLGSRYRDRPIIWILGGDRIPDDDEDVAIIRAMAEGIEAGDGGANPKTYHPMGGRSSAEFFHDDVWLDFNMFQSGHGQVDNPNYQRTLADYRREPVKPVVDGEPNYEDHPINWRTQNGWFDAFDSRRAGYWSMLSGAMGHTYGNHNIWQMWQPGRNPISSARTHWREALTYPGAYQAGYMRHFFESRPWWLLEPAPQRLRRGPNTGGKEIAVAEASDGSFLIGYTPFGVSFTLSTEGLTADRVQVWWFNTATGIVVDGGELDREAEMALDPPADPARGNDWAVILENATLNRPAPGP